MQVFGRRDDETDPALMRPAAEKRQGTKSRDVGQRWCSGRYGDLIPAQTLMVDATGARYELGMLARASVVARNKDFGRPSERMNEGSAR